MHWNYTKNSGQSGNVTNNRFVLHHCLQVTTQSAAVIRLIWLFKYSAAVSVNNNTTTNSVSRPFPCETGSSVSSSNFLSRRNLSRYTAHVLTGSMPWVLSKHWLQLDSHSLALSFLDALPDSQGKECYIIYAGCLMPVPSVNNISSVVIMRCNKNTADTHCLLFNTAELAAQFTVHITTSQPVHRSLHYSHPLQSRSL